MGAGTKALSIFLLMIAFQIEDLQACHSAQHGGHYYRKKRSALESTETSYEAYEYNSSALIDYFTDCMTASSGIAFDWYSATEWTVNESNWFYYTDNNDCASEGADNETNCWLLNVDVFFDESLQTPVKNCIKQFAIDNNYTYTEDDTASTRRKRAAGKTASSESSTTQGDSKNSKSSEMPPKNTECPSTIPPEYDTELQRLLPSDLTKPQDGYLFNITAVITFVDLYTVCTECERYSGEPAVDCYANRLDSLTRSDSRIKEAVQVANARYANGGKTVGNCRDLYHTEWFNIDNPDTGVGDRETRKAISRQFPNQVCERPVGIQAELSKTKKPYGRGNDSLSISPMEGLICLNADQASGRCQDYRVRFCCKDYVGNCKLRFGWTPYFDESEPKNLGEFERLSTVRRANRGRICSNPSAIGATLLSGLPFELTGDVLNIDPQKGLTCYTSEQPDNSCGDYQVRFCCPPIIGKCGEDHWWTKWYNTKPTDEGDDESVNTLSRLDDWQCDGHPSAIEAQEARSRRPYVEPGNRFKYVNPTQGLSCLNAVQDLGTKCKNYRVRFCCQPKPRSETRATTTNAQNSR